MTAYYRGNKYRSYRSPRRSVKRVRGISDGFYGTIMTCLGGFVIAVLYLVYRFFIG